MAPKAKVSAAAKKKALAEDNKQKKEQKVKEATTCLEKLKVGETTKQASKKENSELSRHLSRSDIREATLLVLAQGLTWPSLFLPLLIP